MRLTELSTDQLKSAMDALQRELHKIELRYKPLRSEWNRRKRAELKARRPKSVKPKVRKVKSDEERERARKYAEFREKYTHCWICGRGGWQKPSWWCGPFLIERMHIVNKTRVEDVRVVIPACSLCHRIQHGDYFPSHGRIEPLSGDELIALKLAHDPDNYDPEFLQRHSVRKLVFPAPAPQPKEPR